MPNPATLRERRLRMTKAQLIDEIDTLEQRAAQSPRRPASWCRIAASMLIRVFLHSLTVPTKIPS